MITVYKGEVFHFINDPTTYDNAYEYFPDGAIVVDKGFVVDVGNYSVLIGKYPDLHVVDYSGKLLMPGFIDTHIHYPQMQIVGSFGRQLIDWLNEYTFVAEEQFLSPEIAASIAQDFIYELLKNGTTTCAAYSSVHKCAADALFTAANSVNMRIIAGKVLMERNAPDALCDTVQSAYVDSRELIETWHNRGRNLYALTPRFAITCSMDELTVAGKLHKEYPETYIQTHLSENRYEIEQTLKLFPDCKDYLEVYERAGLVGDHTVFGHGIYLSDSELDRLQRSGAIIAHCPTSNLFLGSGLFNMQRMNSAAVKSTIATDIGAGTTFSLLRTLCDAYKIQQLNGYPLTSLESFYKITLGAARALGLEEKIGSFRIGNEADFVVINYGAQKNQRIRMEYLKKSNRWNVENLLFGLQITGDERNVEHTFVMGKKIECPS